MISDELVAFGSRNNVPVTTTFSLRDFGASTLFFKAFRFAADIDSGLWFFIVTLDVSVFLIWRLPYH